MKRIKFAIIIMSAILVVAAAIFGIAYYFNDKAEKESQAEQDKLIMFEFDESLVDKVEINNESGQFISEYTYENGWYITNVEDFELNDTLISSIITNMCQLKADKIIENADSSKYGFDNPIKVTSYIGDTAYTILIGNTTPTYENFYAMKENDDNIYLIPYANGLTLSASKDKLKRTYILNFKSHEVNHVALWNGSETDENIVFSLDMNENDEWSMTKPYKTNSVSLTEIDSYLTSISRDEIAGFVQEGCTKEEYSKFGFDNPQYVYELSTDAKTRKVIIGKATEEDEQYSYALIEDKQQVITLIPQQISALGAKTLNMIVTSIFSTDISSVSEIGITLQDKNFSMDMSNGENAYEFNDINVSEKSPQAKNAFIDLFNSFNNAYLDATAAAATPTGNAELSLKFTLTNNIVTVIEYIPAENSDEYYAMKDGSYTGYTVKKSVIENVISSYNTLSELAK